MSELKDAAARAAKRRELLKKAVPMLPDDPENIKISKKEFLAKRRHQKEEALAVEQFKKDFRAKKAEDAPEEVKKGRPKKVE